MTTLHVDAARPRTTVFGATPRQLRLLTGTLAALAAVLGLLAALALRSDAAGFAGLSAHTTEASATGDLYYELNDMDAQAADALLVGFHPADPGMVPAAVNAAASDSAYEHDRSAADADLVLIAHNPQLAAQSAHLIDDLGGYEALIAEALYADEGAQDEQPATPPATSLNSYKQASSLLHATLLPLALQISDADNAAVDGSYQAEHRTAMVYGYVVLALALVTAVALYLGNRYHARRFRRRLSLLSGGIVIVLALGGIGLSTQLNTAYQLHYAKQEAYDSVNALTMARAVSDDANADESRWLLEGRDPALQTSFFQKVGAVASVPGVSASAAAADPSAYYSGLSTAVGALRLDAAADSVSGVTIGGYLGTELHNLTFGGEGQAAYAATAAFNAYLQDDATIRADAGSGNLAAAVALDIGTQPGQSNYTFDQYTAKLGAVIRINQAGFTAGVASGESGTDAAVWASMIVGELLLVLFIVQSGLLRLREYR